MDANHATTTTTTIALINALSKMLIILFLMCKLYIEIFIYQIIGMFKNFQYFIYVQAV